MRLSAGAAALAAARSAGAQAATGQRRIEPGSEELTHYQLGPHIWLRWHNELLLAYRAHPTQKYPYFFPFTGPVSGLPLTAESSLPWPHHRSVFFGSGHLT